MFGFDVPEYVTETWTRRRTDVMFRDVRPDVVKNSHRYSMLGQYVLDA